MNKPAISSDAQQTSPRRLDVARLASAAASQLQALLCRPGHLGDRHLDDAAGDQLAGLSADPFGAAAGRC